MPVAEVFPPLWSTGWVLPLRSIWSHWGWALLEQHGGTPTQRARCLPTRTQASPVPTPTPSPAPVTLGMENEDGGG